MKKILRGIDTALWSVIRLLGRRAGLVPSKVYPGRWWKPDPFACAEKRAAAEEAAGTLWTGKLVRW